MLWGYYCHKILKKQGKNPGSKQKYVNLSGKVSTTPESSIAVLTGTGKFLALHFFFFP